MQGHELELRCSHGAVSVDCTCTVALNIDGLVLCACVVMFASAFSCMRHDYNVFADLQRHLFLFCDCFGGYLSNRCTG